jgi:hypothetical protein
VAVPGEQPDAPAVTVDDQAIAIGLDFVNLVRAGGTLIPRVGMQGPLSRSPSAHAVRVKRVSEKNADAEKHKQNRDSLGHRFALSRTMPGTASLTISR